MRLVLANAGRRAVRGQVRDGWEPCRAGDPEDGAGSTIPAGERRATTLVLTPFRRGAAEAAHVTVRSWGPLRIAARQSGARGPPAAYTVLPPFNARKPPARRLAGLRELDGATSVLVRGRGTEFDSLRDYVHPETTSARSTGGRRLGVTIRSARRAPGSWCAPGGPGATAAS